MIFRIVFWQHFTNCSCVIQFCFIELEQMHRKGDYLELHLVKQERHEFFGFGWTFHYGDLDIHEAELGEKDFSPVTLPHDWLMDYEANGPDEKAVL